MAQVIARRSGDDNRLLLIPMQLLLSGPLLFPVAIAGLVWLLRAREGRPWRAIGWAYLVLLGLLLATSGKGYYAGGTLPLLMAAGAVVVDRWLEGGRPRLRVGVFATTAACSGLIACVLLLPIVPLASVGSTPIPAIDGDVANEVGWPAVVSTVTGVVDGLTPEDRSRAVIFTANYGEAGALQLLGPVDLPPVYSGHNSYAAWGPPPERLTVTILVGWTGAASAYGQWLGPCDRAATIDDGYGIPNEEQGAGVWICRQRPVPWDEAWPALAHVS
jgi:hypothetical protein